MALKTKYNIKELADFSSEYWRAMQTHPGAFMDLGAAMAALAIVESAGKLQAKGDSGNSLGLWQINSLVWPDLVRGNFLGSINNQAYAAGIVLDHALNDIAWAIKQRSVNAPILAEPQKPEYLTEETGAWWLSLVWQYGAGTFRAWIVEWGDHTWNGFKAWRKTKGKSVHWAYNRRHYVFEGQYAIADNYLKKNPSFWKDVVIQSTVDLAQLPGKILEEYRAPPAWVYLALVVGGLYLAKDLIPKGRE